MELKGRLKLIADLTPKGDIACDIGTDHAYIPVYLAMNNKCNRAIACDVKEGPLVSARKNIEISGLSGRIETRLGNGLEPIDEKETDIIIIAGMGGMLIKEILVEGKNKAKMANALILQPMNAAEVLREWLYSNGFNIVDEGLIDEGHKIYNVITAKWDGIVRNNEDIYNHIGKVLIEKKDPLLERFILKRVNNLENIISEMDAMKDRDSKERVEYMRVKDELCSILDIIRA